jgi:hypothetical protein
MEQAKRDRWNDKQIHRGDPVGMIMNVVPSLQA